MCVCLWVCVCAYMLLYLRLFPLFSQYPQLRALRAECKTHKWCVWCTFIWLCGMHTHTHYITMFTLMPRLVSALIFMLLFNVHYNLPLYVNPLQWHFQHFKLILSYCTVDCCFSCTLFLCWLLFFQFHLIVVQFVANFRHIFTWFIANVFFCMSPANITRIHRESEWEREREK